MVLIGDISLDFQDGKPIFFTQIFVFCVKKFLTKNNKRRHTVVE